MESNPLVPKLRFPEFHQAPGWESTPLHKLARITQGGTPDTTKPEYWRGSVMWLTPAEMGKSDCPFIAATVRTISHLGLANCSSELLPVRSVVISTRAPIGHLAINLSPMAINQGCRGLIPFAGNATYFLYSSLLCMKPKLIDLGAGSTFKELSGSALQDLRLPAPPPAEQQKIADCLMSLDELIAAQGRKLEALRDLKKGLLQQLFPGEGESRPRLRFPEFRDAGAWTRLTLKNLCAMRAGAFVPACDIVGRPVGELYPCYGGNGLRGYVQTYTHDGDYPLVGRQGALCGNVMLARGKFHATEHAIVATPNAATDAAWLYYALDFLNLNRFATGQAQPGLSVDVLNNIELSAPIDRVEQEGVAGCLLSLDDLISGQTKVLDALKTHKQGLMQGLFPSLKGA
ncbi:MAG: restriction endonuclease subunit S [Armatimonadetes bacterium]|nr:restriction endonuclease subunit S [Armatimonadota bacterium]MDE2206277.1 restriction endonuclease subunit S [Armatimonadota bacterium]